MSGAIVTTTTDKLSDRELDALVAERVFECLVIRYSKLSVGCGCPDEIHARGGDELKPFCGNMNDAMRVVEKMRERGYEICIAATTKTHWQVDLTLFTDGVNYPSNRWQRFDESLPRAICEAALAALSAVKEK